MNIDTANRQWDICPWCGKVGCASFHYPANLADCPAIENWKLPEMVPLDRLEHGAYYHGTCRNGRVARWNAETLTFIHIRVKFASVFPETIGYWVDAQPGEYRFDEFRPYGKMESPPFEIPLAKEPASEHP